jgi:TPR repeat protein
MNDKAMNSMGVMYQNGLGVIVDYPEALRWYKKAADLGNSSAMYNLGTMYEQGLGVEKDAAEARKWFDKAAATERSESAVP